MKGTTIIVVRKNEKTAIAAEGRMISNETIIKEDENKIEKMGDLYIAIAGAVSMGQMMKDMFDKNFDKEKGIEEVIRDTARDIHNTGRENEAVMLIIKAGKAWMITGDGALIEYELERQNIVAIGSGADIAYGAAKALCGYTDKEAKEIARISLWIVASRNICCNDNIQVEEVIE